MGSFFTGAVKEEIGWDEMAIVTTKPIDVDRRKNSPDDLV
jgi:hypothetical protein